LAVIAAVVLLVTGRYPDPIFDFVLGMNRWVLRVAAYAGLMTDRYPPFRLDRGGHDRGPLPLRPAAQAPAEPADPPLTGPRQEFLGQGFVGQADSGPTGGPAGRGGWTTARIISVVAGAVLALFSLGLLGAGSAALWAQTQRHGGYVNLGTASYSAPGYALASDTLGMHMASGGWDGASALVGTVRPGGPAGPGRHLDRAGGRAGHPDADLGGQERRLDAGRHERRRLTAGEHAGQRGRP